MMAYFVSFSTSIYLSNIQHEEANNAFPEHVVFSVRLRH